MMRIEKSRPYVVRVGIKISTNEIARAADLCVRRASAVSLQSELLESSK